MNLGGEFLLILDLAIIPKPIYYYIYNELITCRAFITLLKLMTYHN